MSKRHQVTVLHSNHKKVPNIKGFHRRFLTPRPDVHIVAFDGRDGNIVLAYHAPDNWLYFVTENARGDLELSRLEYDDDGSTVVAFNPPVSMTLLVSWSRNLAFMEACVIAKEVIRIAVKPRCAKTAVEAQMTALRSERRSAASSTERWVRGTPRHAGAR